MEKKTVVKKSGKKPAGGPKGANERHDTLEGEALDAPGATESAVAGKGIEPADDYSLFDPVVAQMQAMQRELDQLKLSQEVIQAALGGELPKAKGRAPVERKVVEAAEPKATEAKRETKASMAQLRKSRKSAAAPATQGREMLVELLTVAEREEEERRRIESLQFDLAGVKERIRVTARDPAELFYAVDIGMVTVICANAVIIGVSMDDDGDATTWKWVEFGFSMAFLAELLFKTCLAGPWRQFCGPGALSNLFDASLITADLVQFIMSAAGSDKKGPSASLFRVIRLVRLMRILRVMRLEFFQGLLAMVGGMITGAPTLLCSMGLFAVTCYILALIFRETIGVKYMRDDDDDPNVTQFFRSVPQSLFMVFRCGLIGDCSTPNGNSAFWEVAMLYGNGWMVVYFIFIFGITVGLFNVIGAIFVEETLKAAKEFELSQKNARLGNKVLWSVNVARLIRCILQEVQQEEASAQGLQGGPQLVTDPPVKLTEHIDEIASPQVTCAMFHKVIHEQEEAKEALDALDIDPNDHGNLDDILDPDNGGIIDIFELIDGIRRLRGDPRRSDIVAVDLMVRSLQKQVEELLRRIAPK